MFKKLFCKHDSILLIRKGEWTPTFHTTNGLDHEDIRFLVFRCEECDKRIERKQIKSHGSIINYRDIK